MDMLGVAGSQQGAAGPQSITMASPFTACFTAMDVSTQCANLVARSNTAIMYVQTDHACPCSPPTPGTFPDGAAIKNPGLQSSDTRPLLTSLINLVKAAVSLQQAQHARVLRCERQLSYLRIRHAHQL